jgi:hypothetical protein
MPAIPSAMVKTETNVNEGEWIRLRSDCRNSVDRVFNSTIHVIEHFHMCVQLIVYIGSMKNVHDMD